MLIVCQTDGVGTQFLDDLCVLIVVLHGQGVALVQLILMAGDTAQRGGLAVDGEAAVRGNGVAAHAYVGVDLVKGLVVALQTCHHGVEVRLVHAPQLSVRDVNRNGRIVRRTNSGSHFASVGVLDAVHHGKAVVGVGDEALDFKGSAAVCGGLGGDHDAGAAVVVQIKVCVGHADQVHAPVQSAVEGKVRRCGVHGGGVLVADLDGQLVVAVTAQVGDVGAEDGEAAFVGGGNGAVHLDGGIQRSCQHLHIHAAAGQRLHRFFKGAAVNAGGAQVAAVAVHAVHGVPGVGQGDGLGGALALGEAQGPAFVQGNDLSHDEFSCLISCFVSIVQGLVSSFTDAILAWKSLGEIEHFRAGIVDFFTFSGFPGGSGWGSCRRCA